MMLLISAISIVTENQIHLVMKWFLLHFSKINPSFVYHSEKWHPAYYQLSGELQVWFLSSVAMLLLRTLNTRTNRLDQSKQEHDTSSQREETLTADWSDGDRKLRGRPERSSLTSGTPLKTDERRDGIGPSALRGTWSLQLEKESHTRPKPPSVERCYHPRKANKSNSPTDKAGTFMKPPEAVVEM